MKKLDEQVGKVHPMTIDGLAQVKARLTASEIQAAEQEIPTLMQEYGLQ